MEITTRNERRRILWLVGLMAILVFVVAVVTAYVLYRTALDEERARLAETVQSQSSLIEAITRHEVEARPNQSPEQIFQLVLQQIIDAHSNFEGFGQTGEFTLGRLEGNQIVFLLRHRHGDLDTPEPVPFDSELAEPMQSALLGESGTLIGLDYRGARVLAAYEPVAIAGYELGIVAKIDLAEVQAPFIRAALLAGGCGIFLVVLGSLLFERLSEPLIRQLEERQEWLSTTLQSIGDAVIATDTQGRVRFMNPVAETLTGWRAGEAADKPLDTVFNIINEETGEPQEDPVKKVLREGIVVGLANHTALIARDGTQRTIADSGAPIKDGKGDLLGVVLVFRDVTEGARAEEKMQASETRYRRLFESARDGILILDAETGKIVAVNPFLAELLGYSQEEFLGKMLWEIGPFRDIDETRAAFLELQTEGYVRYEHLPLETRDGRLIDVEFVSNTYLVDHTRVIQCNIRDMTERRQMEETLQESHNQFLAVLGGIDAHIYAADLETYEILFANKEMQSAFGGPLIGQICYKAFRGESEQCAHCTNDRLLDDAGNLAGVIVWEGHNPITGRWYNNYDRAIKWVDGRIVRLQIAVDITERKQAEEKLRAERDKAQQYLNIAGVIIVALDREGTLKLINRKGCQVLGYKETELLDTNWFEQCLPSAERADVRAVFDRLMAGEMEPVEYFENHILTKDGSERIVAWHNTILKDESGNIVGTLSSGEDITERKRVQEALRQSEERLQRLFGTMAEGVVLIAPDGRIVQANPAAEHMLGLERREIETRNYVSPAWDIIRPDGTPMPPEEMAGPRAMMEKTSVKDIVMGVRRPDGSVTWINVSAAPIIGEAGKLEAVVGTFVDVTERKRAEEALRQSEERFRRAILDAPFPLMLHAEDGEVVLINEAWTELTGYTHQEIPTIADWMERAYGERKALPVKAIEDLFTHDTKVNEGEFVITTKAGASRVWDFSSSPLGVLPDGRRLVLSMAIDITERKRAEEALRENEAIFSSFLEHSPVYVFFKDRDIRSLRLSTNYEQMLGMPLSEALGKSMDELFPSDLARSMVADDRKILGEGEVVKVVEELGGRTYETTKFPIFKDGKPNMLAGFTLDITERRQAEEALQESEEKYRSIVETTAEWIWEIDLNGRHTFSSQGVTAILGYRPEELVGQASMSLLHPEDQAEVETTLPKLMAEKRGWKGWILRWRHKDGSYRFLESNAAPILDSSGHIRGYRGTDRDITERKQAEEELARYRERLEELVEERTRELAAANERLQQLGHVKDQFIANVSHELRTPITSLRLYHHLLTERPEKRETYMATLQRETERLEHIVEDLLYLSRMDQGEITAALVAVDLNALIKTHVTDRATLAEARGLTLTMEQEPDLPEVQADPLLFERVLSILLTNAFNYTPEGGRVTVRTHDREVEGAHWVGVSVSDTGPGIPSDELPHMFERFFRGNMARLARVPGTGLGLAIAKEIVDQHQGHIEVASERVPGQGATFTVWLPFQQQ